MHWITFWEGIGIFAISCLFPYIALRTASREAKGWLAAIDAALTFVSLLLVAHAFRSNGWLWAVGGWIVFSAVYGATGAGTEKDAYGFKAYAAERKEKRKNT